MADALKCRAQNDEGLVNEIHETMDTLVSSCVMVNTTVIRFKYALGEIVNVADVGPAVIMAQIHTGGQPNAVTEMYMTDMTDVDMVPVDSISPTEVGVDPGAEKGDRDGNADTN